MQDPNLALQLWKELPEKSRRAVCAELGRLANRAYRDFEIEAEAFSCAMAALEALSYAAAREGAEVSATAAVEASYDEARRRG